MLPQLEDVNIRGSAFCGRLIPELPQRMGSGYMTIALLDSTCSRTEDEMAHQMAASVANHYNANHTVCDGKTVKVVSMPDDNADITEDENLCFQTVNIRTITRSAVWCTSSPARIVGPYPGLDWHLPVFLRVPDTDPVMDQAFREYYAPTWSHIAALHDPRAWLEEIHTKIRLPPTLTQNAESDHLRWTSSVDHDGLRALAEDDSKHCEIKQIMYYTLFRFEKAAQRPLLLPRTQKTLEPDACIHRKTCVEEEMPSFESLDTGSLVDA